MRGRPPLTLFTTLARDRRLFFKHFGGGLLDRGHLTLRQREIVIDRRSMFADEAILELLLLVGFYHTTSFVVNSLALSLESGMARFNDFRATA